MKSDSVSSRTAVSGRLLEKSRLSSWMMIFCVPIPISMAIGVLWVDPALAEWGTARADVCREVMRSLSQVGVTRLSGDFVSSVYNRVLQGLVATPYVLLVLVARLIHLRRRGALVVNPTTPMRVTAILGLVAATRLPALAASVAIIAVVARILEYDEQAGVAVIDWLNNHLLALGFVLDKIPAAGLALWALELTFGGNGQKPGLPAPQASRELLV